eukprot:1144993-Pelagomonas_calceolata.AAC.2
MHGWVVWSALSQAGSSSATVYTYTALAAREGAGACQGFAPVWSSLMLLLLLPCAAAHCSCGPVPSL